MFSSSLLVLIFGFCFYYAEANAEEISMGTTLVALKYDGGVVVGADSRTSVFPMVSNKFAKKINVVVNSDEVSCAICRSGSAADTQFLADAAKENFLSRRWKDNFLHPTVSQVAHYLRHRMRSDSSSRTFQASLICAGRDDSGGRIFAIAVDGGAMLEEDVFCVSGSGSTFLVGYLDSLNMNPSKLCSEREAIELVSKLLKLSMTRDGASGGLIRMIVLKKGGTQELVEYPEPGLLVELPGFAEASSVKI